MPEPDAGSWAEIDAALAAGNLMHALARYRGITGAGIGPARVLLEARRAALPGAAPPVQPAPDAMPDAVQRYLASGHARPGALLGWWTNSRGEWNVLVAPTATPGELELGVFGPEPGPWGHTLHGHRLGSTHWRALLSGDGNPPGTDFGPPAGSRSIRLALAQAIHALPVATPVITRMPIARPSLNKGFVAALDVVPFERDWLFLTLPPADPGALAARARADIDTCALWQDTHAAADLEPALRAGAGTLFASGVLLELALAECGRDHTGRFDVDAPFSDLAAQPPAAATLTPALLQALALWLAIADPQGRRPTHRPAWLQATAHGRACAGLLSPPEVRELARWLDDLLPLLMSAAGARSSGRDLQSIAAVVRTAAAAGHWLLGWEPG